MTMLKKYIEQDNEYVKKFGEKTIFLIQCGSFYEVYSCKKNDIFVNKRIVDFSKICNDMRIADKKAKYKGLSVFMCGFPELFLEKYVKKLTDAGWTVCVHNQDPTCPTIRKELGIFSPGTNFSGGTESKNRIMAIWLEKYDKTIINKTSRIVFGIACVDIVSGDVITYQGLENYFHNPTTFDELERFYCSYNPNELIIIHNFSENELKDIISFVEIDASLIHSINIDSNGEWATEVTNCTKQIYQEEQLTKYYSISDYDTFCEIHFLQENEISTSALVFLLNFLDHHNHDLVKQLKEPIITNVKDRVRLANHSLRQLNIIDTGKKHKYSSLLSLVNKCKTPMGRRFLEHKLLNPTLDVEYLKKEYNILKHIKNIDYATILKELEHIGDFERLFRKMILNRVVPSDISTLHENLNKIKNIAKFVKENEKLNNYVQLFNLSNSIKIVQTKIKTNIDVKKASNINVKDFDINIFKEGINPALDEAEYKYLDIQGQLEGIKVFLDSHIKEKTNAKCKEKVRIHQTEKSGLFLITTKTRSKKLFESLNNKSEYIIPYKVKDENKTIVLNINEDKIRESGATGSNVRLDNALLNKIYTKYSQTKSNLKDLLLSTFRNFVSSFTENKLDFELIIKYIVKVDFLLTRAHVAKLYKYCCPEIEDREQSFVVAKDLRHPIIERLQENEIYVPNDVSLGVNDTGILLFGTNAVGKSSLIRSLGMSVILAQAGFFVPCSSFTFKPYSSIFTRILGNDDIFKGLSTFAVEMSELSCILKNANKNSLILGDELCSGTETTSALCIFTAGIMMLHKINSSFIFATHFHEIVENNEIRKLDRLALQHMVVTYDVNTKTLIYDRKIRSGVGNRLYGLEVCKSLCMPTEFLNMANKLRTHNEPTVLSLKQSRYNSNKIKNKCEFCNKDATEIHHIQPQEDAIDGFIDAFPKNHKANLTNICKECHLNFTKNKVKHRKVKTNTGTKLQVIE